MNIVEDIVSAIGNNGLTRVERQTDGTQMVSVSWKTVAETYAL